MTLGGVTLGGVTLGRMTLGTVTIGGVTFACVPVGVMLVGRTGSPLGPQLQQLLHVPRLKRVTRCRGCFVTPNFQLQ